MTIDLLKSHLQITFLKIQLLDKLFIINEIKFFLLLKYPMILLLKTSNLINK